MSYIVCFESYCQLICLIMICTFFFIEISQSNVKETSDVWRPNITVWKLWPSLIYFKIAFYKCASVDIILKVFRSWGWYSQHRIPFHISILVYHFLIDKWLPVIVLGELLIFHNIDSQVNNSKTKIIKCKITNEEFKTFYKNFSYYLT